MIKGYLGICCVVLCGLAPANAALIAVWNFNSDTTLPTDASFQNSNLDATPTLNTSGGTGATATLPGTLLRFTTPTSGNRAAAINGMAITLTINAGAATFANFSAIYFVDNIGFTALNGRWTYSLNGGAFNNVSGSPLEGLTTDGFQSDTLGGIFLGADQDLRLRFTFSNGAGANGSAITFDNLIISGDVTPITPVPEPVNVALGFFGVLALGVTVGSRMLPARKA